MRQFLEVSMYVRPEEVTDFDSDTVPGQVYVKYSAMGRPEAMGFISVKDATELIFPLDFWGLSATL